MRERAATSATPWRAIRKVQPTRIDPLMVAPACVRVSRARTALIDDTPHATPKRLGRFLHASDVDIPPPTTND